MHIIQSYKYIKDGTIYVGGQVPEGAEVLETMDILNAERGYYLVRISDDERIGSNIWLRDGDVKENYKEAERERTDDRH